MMLKVPKRALGSFNQGTTIKSAGAGIHKRDEETNGQVSLNTLSSVSEEQTSEVEETKMIGKNQQEDDDNDYYYEYYSDY